MKSTEHFVFCYLWTSTLGYCVQRNQEFYQFIILRWCIELYPPIKLLLIPGVHLSVKYGSSSRSFLISLCRITNITHTQKLFTIAEIALIQ